MSRRDPPAPPGHRSIGACELGGSGGALGQHDPSGGLVDESGRCRVPQLEGHERQGLRGPARTAQLRRPEVSWASAGTCTRKTKVVQISSGRHGQTGWSAGRAGRLTDTTTAGTRTMHVHRHPNRNLRDEPRSLRAGLTRRLAGGARVPDRAGERERRQQGPREATSGPARRCLSTGNTERAGHAAERQR